jgi:hypothetical protein
LFFGFEITHLLCCMFVLQVGLCKFIFLLQEWLSLDSCLLEVRNILLVDMMCLVRRFLFFCLRFVDNNGCKCHCHNGWHLWFWKFSKNQDQTQFFDSKFFKKPKLGDSLISKLRKAKTRLSYQEIKQPPNTRVFDQFYNILKLEKTPRIDKLIKLMPGLKKRQSFLSTRRQFLWETQHG